MTGRWCWVLVASLVACDQTLIIGYGTGGGGQGPTAGAPPEGGRGGAGGSEGGAGGTGLAGGMGGIGGAGGEGGGGGSPPICEGPTGSIFHTTLDDPASTLNPLVGDGTGASFTTRPANDFVPAQSGNGLRLDQIGEAAIYGEAPAEVPNIRFARGTLDFCILPGFGADDQGALTLFESRGLVVRRTGLENPGDLIVDILGVEAALLGQARVAAADLPLQNGVWTRLTVTWNRDVAADQPNVHVYFDGAEATYTSQPTGALPALPPMSGRFFRVGAGSKAEASSNGVFDEVRIHDVVLDF